MKRKVIKTFDKPTDIVIYGSCYTEDYESDVALTDNEASYNIIIDGVDNSYRCSSIGFVSILELKEFKKEVYSNYEDEEYEDDDEQLEYFFNGPVDSFYLKQFVGEIAVKVTCDNIFVDIDNIDFDDYIYHQQKNIKTDNTRFPRLDVYLELPKCDIELLDEDSYKQIITLKNRKDIINELYKQ